MIVRSIALGVGLAMDAFSVSIANGLKEINMKAGRMCTMAGVYAFFQFLMPAIGWFCVRSIAQSFSCFEMFIPWIALILLLYIGGKMILGGIRNKPDVVVAEADEKTTASGKGQRPSHENRIGPGTLVIQGIATSIDALSVGFAFSGYVWYETLLCATIIAAVTFVICMSGLLIGMRFGGVKGISERTGIIGGIILVIIGLEIFVRGVIL